MATVLFLAPHQDDEVLTMGAAIRAHLEAGHDVHVVLATTGVNSGVRSQLGLSRPQFTAARDDEFRRACRALGVPADNVHISRHAVDDGQLTVAAARDVVLAALERFPGAWVKTHSDRFLEGRHVDHVNLGRAAVELYREGLFGDLRLYVEPYEMDRFRAAYPSIVVSPERAATPAAVRAAIDAYQRVDAVAGMYGIGYRSTKSFFDLVDADPVSYRHVP